MSAVVLLYWLGGLIWVTDPVKEVLLTVGLVIGGWLAGEPLFNWDMQYIFSRLAKISRSLSRSWSLVLAMLLSSCVPLASVRSAYAKLFHVLWLCWWCCCWIFRFNVGVSIFEFRCCEYEITVSFGWTRLADRVNKSLPVRRWNLERSCLQMKNI